MSVFRRFLGAFCWCSIRCAGRAFYLSAAGSPQKWRFRQIGDNKMQISRKTTSLEPKNNRNAGRYLRYLRAYTPGRAFLVPRTHCDPILLWARRLRTITQQLLIAYTAGQPVTPQTHGRRTEAQPRTIDMQGNRKDSQSPRRRKNASTTDPLPLASSTLQAVPISVHKCVQPCRGDHGPR